MKASTNQLIRLMQQQFYEEMKKAARDLDFERAAELRDEIRRIETAQKIAESKK